MRQSSSPSFFRNFRIRYVTNHESALFSFSYDGTRIAMRTAQEDDGWYINRSYIDVPHPRDAWRETVRLLTRHRTPRVLDLGFDDLAEETVIKHWDDWRAHSIAVALIEDKWECEHAYAGTLLSFSDAQLERIWLDYGRSLLGDFVSELAALRLLELDEYASFRTEHLGQVFEQHGYSPDGPMTAEQVFASLHREVEQRKREATGVEDPSPSSRKAWRGPFQDFEIGINAAFLQPWNVRYDFSLCGDAVLRFEFISNGTMEWNYLSYRQLHGESAWRAALSRAATLDIGMLCPHHVRSYELSGWNNWRAELVVVALLRDKFRRESRYGRALLSLTVKQATQLHKEFGSFIRHPYLFIDFLEKFRAVDAAPDYDRDDLRGFLKRYGYGAPGVTTSQVIARAENDHRETLAARPPESAVPRKGLIERGFRLAEENGWAGLSLSFVGGFANGGQR